MNNVTIFHNALDATDRTTFEGVDDVCKLLTEQFGSFPSTAKIYHRFVAESNNVTPHDESGIELLQRLSGSFYVVVYPEDPVTIIAIVAIAIAAVAIGFVFLFRPTKPGQNQGSPNNELSDRQNQARPNQRIPDISGTVRSTLDLLALPYKTFIANEEYEFSYMGIGRGYYDVLDCRDDTTPVDDIDGEFVAVYPPFNSPNSSSPTIQATFGTAPTAIPPVLTVQRSNVINGQTLRAPNSGNMTTNNNVSFKFGGIVLTNDPNVDFTQYFVASTTGNDQFLEIKTNDDGINATDPGGSAPSVGLAGVYKILTVATGQITLSNVAAVNANWSTLASYSGQQSTYFHTFVIQSSGDKWVGPFVLAYNNMGQVWANIVAQNGLYYVDNKGRQGALSVTVEMRAQAVDAAFNPIGDEIVGTINLTGSANTRNIVGSTLRLILPENGPCQVRMRLVTPMGVDTRNTYVQQIQWRDLYAVSPVLFNVPPPLPTNPNEYVLWAKPGSVTQHVGNPAFVSVSATEVACNIGVSNSSPLGNDDGSVTYGNWQMPSGVNVSTITRMIPMCIQTASGSGGGFLGTFAPIGPVTDQKVIGASIGTTGAALSAYNMEFEIDATLPIGPIVMQYGASLVAVAVYFTLPSNNGGQNANFAAAPGDFGNITTAMCITKTTADSLTIKERKLNMLVTRKLPTWINRTAPGVPQFSSALYPTNNAADILCAFALDPFIGRRTIAELDVPEIYGIADAAYLANSGEHVDGTIAAYFGSFLMCEFCYTFDDSKVSFEEMVYDIAQSINCVAYRSGSKIRLAFEKLTANSRMIFNHRNKLPGSETRTFTFGVLNDNDGINFDYIDPNALNLAAQDTQTTFYFPADQSAVNPKSVTSRGIRNPVQAQINGWRMYNKLLYSNLQSKFSATHEAAMRVVSDRILVADNTRTGTQDGQLEDFTGLTATTSQKVTFVGGHTYTAFFQHYDDTVEAIAVTAGPNDHSMVLATAPALPFVTDEGKFAQTTYILVDDSDTTAGTRPTAFLVAEKDPQSNGLYDMTAINYDTRYYQHDQDAAIGAITAPLYGYSAQGYIGIGDQKADGTPYTSTRSGFNNGVYPTSLAGVASNVPAAQQVTIPPPVSVNKSPIEVAGLDKKAAITNLLSNGNPVGSRPVNFVLGGNSDLQTVQANVVLEAGTVLLILDGGGGPIQPISKVYAQMPYAGEFTAFVLLADQAGSITIDLKKCSYAAFPTTATITGSQTPALVGAQKASVAITGSGWAFAAGDIIEFVVAVAATSITRVSLQLATHKD